jgi:hypothetical protein
MTTRVRPPLPQAPLLCQRSSWGADFKSAKALAVANWAATVQLRVLSFFRIQLYDIGSLRLHVRFNVYVIALRRRGENAIRRVIGRKGGGEVFARRPRRIAGMAREAR